MCVCVCGRLLCGLRCKRAVRTHLADKQAAGWLGNRRAFVGVCLFSCVHLIEEREKKKERERESKQ